MKNVEIKRDDCQNNIYSLRNSDSIQGQFFLGSGTVSGVEYYYMFEKDSRGGYFRNQLKSDNCYLFQDASSNSYVSWQQITYRPNKMIHIWPKIEWKKDTMYELHIPVGSIIEEFKVK